MDEHTPRPSSWPARNVRRHLALQANYDELKALLGLVLSRLERLEIRVVPPGLAAQVCAGEVSSKLEAQEMIFDAVSVNMLQLIQQQSVLESRLISMTDKFN